MHLLHLHLSAAAILGVAATIYAILQSAKRAGLDGYISGRLGLAFATVCGFVSTIALAGNLSPDTLCTALAVALGASGLHAGVKVAATGTLGAAPQAPKASKAAKLAVLALVALLPLGAASCTNRAAVGVPTAVQTLQAAAAATDSVASGLKLAQDSLRALHQGGEITDAEAKALNAWLVSVAQKNDVAIAAISAANGSATTAANAGTGWQASLAAVSAAVGALPPEEFDIKNSAAKQTFTMAAGVLESAIAVINSQITGSQQ